MSTPPADPAAPGPSATPTASEVRSQAVAKLKRAASLPRQKSGRRPSQSQADDITAAVDPASSSSAARTPEGARHVGPEGREEVLSPSPVAPAFPPDVSAGPSSTPLRRSNSSGSSTFPSPGPSTSYQSSAQSVLLAPVSQPYPPSAFHAPGTPSQTQGAGRNTPSPLPTLADLGNLQRSNSTAARNKALSKLTGGGGAKGGADEGEMLLAAAFNKGGLQRAGTLGHASSDRTQDTFGPTIAEPNATIAFTDRRPPLQRSFTVSSTNMGEERRSAVGRRMMERLAHKRLQAQGQVVEVDESVNRGIDAKPEESHPPYADNSNGHVRAAHHIQPSNGLLAPLAYDDKDRPISGATMAPSEAFEFDAHLRRSLSARTARTATRELGQSPSAVPPTEEEDDDDEAGPDDPTLDSRHFAALTQRDQAQPYDDVFDLTPPRPAFYTSSRDVASGSTSYENAGRTMSSPSGDSLASRDPFGSMQFVMGGPTTRGARPGQDSWPVEVGEGSDYGTPMKHANESTFSDAVIHRSPVPAAHADLTPTGDASSPYQTANEAGSSADDSRRTSVMSWEEVGGLQDLEVPADAQYGKKSGSISAKLGRSVKDAMKKRSQSGASVSSLVAGSPPTSPRQGLNDGHGGIVRRWSRRGSETSGTPSTRRTSKDTTGNAPADPVKHQPSVSSLSPSLPSQRDSANSHANSALLQHQLSQEPNGLTYVKRAELSDPRVFDSKLSPFPGAIVRSGSAPGIVEAPKMLHQASDSVVPSQQRVLPSAVGADIYALPLPQNPDVRRGSDDSVSKRNWLAKAFNNAATPRSSGSTAPGSRKGSLAEGRVSPTKHTRKPSADRLGQTVVFSDPDPFADLPPPHTRPAPQQHQIRSTSPAVSVVPELSEEGSRFTRFTNTTRMENASPLPEQDEAHLTAGDGLVPDVGLPRKSVDVLNRMDDLLALTPDNPARPDMLDDPPRKLLAATQILQVVNINTAKDRFLFLFNDILVITKPLFAPGAGAAANLDMNFEVKSIVSLDKLTVTGTGDEPTVEPERHAVVLQFIEAFATDPVAACRFLVERSSPRIDTPTLASLIFKTSELDKTQIGVLLAGNEKLMRAFIDRFHFVNVRIDDALRMFLLSVRLPTDPTAAEKLLRGFAHRYVEVNAAAIRYTGDLAAELVMSIMQLNDSMYQLYGFALRNAALTKELLVSAFDSKDPDRTVGLDLLGSIYDSIAKEPIYQALTTTEEGKLGYKVDIEPKRLPSKLTYNVWSEPITITIPKADPAFACRLLGEGLAFDPPLLSFQSSNKQSVRMKGTSLGPKSMLFERIGSNAPLYASIGNTRTMTVERAFMRHTFHVAFVSHLGLRRKYCFSVADAQTRQRWGALLHRQVAATRQAKAALSLGPSASQWDQVRLAADSVALQVLRDALIPPDEKRSERPELGGRKGSVSATYMQGLGRGESGLGPLQPSKGTGMEDKTQRGLVEVQTGKELVLLCRQNSLLPGLLELLQAGV